MQSLALANSLCYGFPGYITAYTTAQPKANKWQWASTHSANRWFSVGRTSVDVSTTLNKCSGIPFRSHRVDCNICWKFISINHTWSIFPTARLGFSRRMTRSCFITTLTGSDVERSVIVMYFYILEIYLYLQIGQITRLKWNNHAWNVSDNNYCWHPIGIAQLLRHVVYNSKLVLHNYILFVLYIV